MKSYEDIRVGDKVFYQRPMSVGYNPLHSWDIVEITRLTKTLVIVGDMRFKRKHCFGVDLYVINEETKREAELNNRAVRQNQLCGEFSRYKWGKVDLDKLLQIEAILTGDEFC